MVLKWYTRNICTALGASRGGGQQP